MSTGSRPAAFPPPVVPRRRTQGWLRGAGPCQPGRVGREARLRSQACGTRPAQAGGTVTLTGTGGESGDAKGVTARREQDPGTLAAPAPQPTGRNAAP